MLTPADADAKISESIRPFPTEMVDLSAAQGRVLAEEIRADRDFPPFDRVTFDGYALRADDLKGSDPQSLFRIDGVQAAGELARPLESAAMTCREIMTGAMLPPGADSIIPYEDTTAGPAGFMQILPEGANNLRAGNAVHPRGSDHRRGGVLVPRGTMLDGRALAVAAACGRSEISVARTPRLAVIATGDELVEISARPNDQQIRRSNDVALQGALIAAGFPGVRTFHFPDDRGIIESQLARLLAELDVLVLTGGVSKGKFDFLPAALQAQGVRQIFHRVAQRPGKPLWFGISSPGVAVFALPGNPVSSYTCLHRYVIPALRRASGARESGLHLRVKLGAPAPGLGSLTCFLPVRLRPNAEGEIRAIPEATNTSGDFSGLLDSDGFIELPAHDGNFAPGFAARYYAWC